MPRQLQCLSPGPLQPGPNLSIVCPPLLNSLSLMTNHSPGVLGTPSSSAPHPSVGTQRRVVSTLNAATETLLGPRGLWPWPGGTEVLYVFFWVYVSVCIDVCACVHVCQCSCMCICALVCVH